MLSPSEMRLSISSLFGLLLLSGCSLPAAETTTNAVSKVAITNLLSHMKEYWGKRVEATGYYKSGFELSALYQNQDDAGSFRNAKGLWIQPFVKPGHEKQVKFVKE